MTSELTISAPLIGGYLLTALISYMLGSISFAIIFSELFNSKDVRDYGSGNAGATNVFRSVGIKAGICTFVLDLAKGAAAIAISECVYRMIVSEFSMPSSIAAISIGKCIAGIFAVLGHLYPLYFEFRGGKGVLTISGIILMLSPIRFLIVLGVFIVVFAITRTVSKGSCAGGLAYPIITFLNCYYGEYKANPVMFPKVYVVIQTVMAVVLASILIIKHKENIKRMIAGTEPKMVFKKNKH